MTHRAGGKPITGARKPPHGGGSDPGPATNSLGELARRVRTADVVDAMGRLHQHRSDLLDLVSPTPGRVLLGRP